MEFKSWEIAYNALLLVGGIFLVIYFLKRKNLFAFFSGLAFYGIIAVGMAFLLAPDNFGVLRLLCYALFLHGIILCDIFFVLLHKHYKTLSFLSAFGSFIILIIGVDSFFIEPHALQVTRIDLKSQKITKPVKIAVLSDLQTDEITDHEKKVFEIISLEKPDLLLMTGDYIQTDNQGKREQLYRELNAIVRERNLSSPLGIFAVRGDIDGSDWIEIFEGSEINTFDKTAVIEKEDLVLTALSPEDSYNSGIEIQRHSKFHIVMGHAPDFALSWPEADLLVAGHTHGGQVQLPFIGPVLKLSEVPGKWASGMNDIDEDTKLIVSRGIGMERNNAPRLRFLCRPEIVLLTINPVH